MTHFLFRLKTLTLRYFSRKSGQTLVEYALILAFISIIAILVLQQLGGEIYKVYAVIKGKIQEAPNASTNINAF